MKNLQTISEDNMKNIIGGKYYGNGVYCGKKTCQVDWSQAWGAIGNNLVNSIAGGAGGMSNPGAYAANR